MMPRRGDVVPIEADGEFVPGNEFFEKDRLRWSRRQIVTTPPVRRALHEALVADAFARTFPSRASRTNGKINGTAERSASVLGAASAWTPGNWNARGPATTDLATSVERQRHGERIGAVKRNPSISKRRHARSRDRLSPFPSAKLRTKSGDSASTLEKTRGNPR